ncbi:MAG TPA: integrase arm-type DNA-binding domain-containing protein, partial [Novosphingobium sp.]|nr:integrase arm-type DNA-binding domain-containing protein [Novosphingobium sp.]
MALTDIGIRNAKPGDKPIKLADGAGMFLLVTPAGGKLWRLKYRIDGREKLLAIGSYPELSLSDARKRREEARAMIAQGKDPSREKQRDKVRSRIQAADTFTAIANEYCAKRKRDGEKGWSPATATRSEYLLSLLNPSIGKLAIAEIEPADVLVAVRKIEAKGNLESARRTLQLASMVFRYAVATARLRSDPTRDLRGALTAPKVTHYGAITEPKRVGELLRAIDGYEGSGITKLALQIAPHVFVRPGELRHAEWSEIDLDGALWIIP